MRHEFVEYIPERLAADTLYISLPYATAVHLCCCGCGNQVVTPLAPTGWTLKFNGAVSLEPSIGNWSFPCQSHYWVRQDKIEWARGWSRAEIARVRDIDSRTPDRKHRALRLPTYVRQVLNKWRNK